MTRNSISVKDWFIICLIMCIPAVNIGFLLYWAFGAEESFKTNFAKAFLLVISTFTLLGLALFIITGVSEYESNEGNYYENLAKMYETNDKVLVRDYAEDDLNVVDIQIKQSNYGAFVTFIIKNQSDTNTQSRIWLDLGFYDAQNVLLDTYSLQLDTIPPGDTYKKEQFFSDVEIENIDDVALIEVLKIY